MTPGQYIGNVLKVGDVAINVVLLFSEKVETFSRRAGRAAHGGKRWGCIVCALLNPAARVVCRILGIPGGRPEDVHCESARLAGEIE